MEVWRPDVGSSKSNATLSAATSPLPISMPVLLDKCGSLISASRFEQVRIFRHWLLPILQKRITE
jgi:mediator of RNA polymerase II transcription subunit 12